MHAVLLVEQDRRRGRKTAFLDPGEQALADDVVRAWLRHANHGRPITVPTMATPTSTVAGGDDLLLGLRHDRLQLHRIADHHHALAARQREQRIQHAGAVRLVEEDVVVDPRACDVLEDQRVDGGEDDVAVAEVGVRRGVKRARLFGDALVETDAGDALLGILEERQHLHQHVVRAVVRVRADQDANARVAQDQLNVDLSGRRRFSRARRALDEQCLAFLESERQRYGACLAAIAHHGWVHESRRPLGARRGQ